MKSKWYYDTISHGKKLEMGEGSLLSWDTQKKSVQNSFLCGAVLRVCLSVIQPLPVFSGDYLLILRYAA